MWKLVVECTTKAEINGKEYDTTARVEYKANHLPFLENIIELTKKHGTGEFKYIVTFEKEGEK